MLHPDRFLPEDSPSLRKPFYELLVPPSDIVIDDCVHKLCQIKGVSLRSPEAVELARVHWTWEKKLSKKDGKVYSPSS